MRPVLIFLGTAFGFAIALSAIVGATGGHDSPLIGLGALTMFIPGLAAAVAGASSKDPVWVDWGRFPVRYVPAALLLMPAALHAVMLPITAALAGGLPWGGPLASRPIGGIVSNAVFGVVAVSLLAFFEEIGWRAWLLPRLALRFTPRSGIVAVAAIWALWHISFVLSGILRVEAVNATTLAAILPAGQFGAGIVIGCLWVRTRSIWIVSIAHGSLNNWGQYAFKLMRDVPAVQAHEAPILAAGSAALVALGCVLLTRTAAEPASAD
jgi:membrane protease YdiL (CAAX protease family)